MSRSSGGSDFSVPCRFEYTGTGGALFGELILGLILSACTFGLYLPWFVCRLNAFVAQNTRLVDSRGNAVHFNFVGTGSDLFVHLIIGAILTACTFGIYWFWFSVNLTRFSLENLIAEDSNGEPVDIAFNGTGMELFSVNIIGYILTILTFGLYTPWLICSLHRYFYENTSIHAGDNEMRLTFMGTGGELFVTFVVGYLLSICTLGLYSFWFHVQLIRFTSGNTTVTTSRGGRYRVDFTGTGWEYFCINFLGIVLSMLTLGIYYFWFLNNLIRFQTDYLEVERE